MPNVFEINSVGSAIAFLAWTLVVIALTKALFGSFLAAELTWRLHQRSARKRETIQRLQWEIKHGAKWDPDVVRQSPHAARQTLTTAEAARKRAELEALARGSFWVRAGRYFASCFACQSFWAALGLCLVIRGPQVGAIASALAYSAAATAATIPTHRAMMVGQTGDTTLTRTGCRQCGG